MAAMLASSPPQPLPKSPPSIPLSPISNHHLPISRTRNLPAKTLHSSPCPDWPWEQRLQESLDVLDLMEAQAISPDTSLFCTLLKGCADAQNPRFGRIIHDRVIQSGLHGDPLVVNNLILMYSRCGLLGTARKLFDEMPVKTVVSWTTAISMYHHAGFSHDAVELYRLMKTHGGVRPNVFTYTVVLNACASTGNLEMGRKIHEEITRDGCEQDEFMVVALIDMYAKCRSVCNARQVFDEIGKLSVESFTAMIEGYIADGDGQAAMELVRRALQVGPDAEVASKLGFATIIRPCTMEMALRQGQEIHAHIIKFGHKPGMKTLHCLIDLYERCDKVMYAYWLLNELVSKDGHLWGRIIYGFIRSGLYIDAVKVYVDMACSGTALNPSAVCLALNACAGMLGLEEGRQIHGQVIKVRNLFSKDSVLGGLAELYNSCGEDEEAQKLMKHLTSLAAPTPHSIKSNRERQVHS